jgi:hypothetical protein
MGDVSPIFEIGPMVWRSFGKIEFSRPFDEWDPDMIEPWSVERVTPQQVFIRSYIDPENPAWRTFKLSRGMLQRNGWAVSRTVSNGAGETLGAVFLARRPEAYRRKTIGYLMQSEARAVLGVSMDASDSDVRAAYLALIKIHHPDRGGSFAQFAAVQEAYENLGRSPTLGDLVNYLRRESDI